MRSSDDWFEFIEVPFVDCVVFCTFVFGVDGPVVAVGASFDVLECFFVDIAYAVLTTGFDSHVGESHAVFEGQGSDA